MLTGPVVDCIGLHRVLGESTERLPEVARWIGVRRVASRVGMAPREDLIERRLAPCRHQRHDGNVDQGATVEHDGAHVSLVLPQVVLREGRTVGAP